MTIATVESCTAGKLAHLLSQGEGASVLHGGFIVSTKENKTAAVGVPSKLIEKHTAVSAEIVQAMATGGPERCPAKYGNPVGLVFARDGSVQVARREFGSEDKDRICSAAMGAALDLMEALLRAHVP